MLGDLNDVKLTVGNNEFVLGDSNYDIIRGDLFLQLLTEEANTLHYHIEFQTLNDSSMAIRMLGYGQNTNFEGDVVHMGNKISKGRKTIYYIGLALIILGFILFMSFFFTPFIAFDRPHFDTGMPGMVKNAPIGMICMIVGAILMNIGASGAAGSGLILDPEKAREDLKPYNTARGQMINDVVSQVDLLNDVKLAKNSKQPQQLIKVKCSKCGALNDEDSMFCKACGDKI